MRWRNGPPGPSVTPSVNAAWPPPRNAPASPASCNDSAGHAINVILVQAGAARLLHERDAQGSQRAIATIEHVGIAGMRERAGLLGGTLRTSVDNGTFRLRAQLPCGEMTL